MASRLGTLDKEDLHLGQRSDKTYDKATTKQEGDD